LRSTQIIARLIFEGFWHERRFPDQLGRGEREKCRFGLTVEIRDVVKDFL
jgi:hypothetical protein